jgi:Mg/Co/Ni transporter MgtE
MEERKLKFSEVMILSKILRQINIKSYVEYLTGNKIDKMLKSTKSLPEDQRKEAMSNNQKILALDVITWIASNMGESEELFYKLFASYTGEGIKAVEGFDFDKVIDVFQAIFSNGLPKIILNMIDAPEIKKKMDEMKNL